MYLNKVVFQQYMSDLLGSNSHVLKVVFFLIIIIPSLGYPLLIQFGFLEGWAIKAGVIVIFHYATLGVFILFCFYLLVSRSIYIAQKSGFFMRNKNDLIIKVCRLGVLEQCLFLSLSFSLFLSFTVFFLFFSLQFF